MFDGLTEAFRNSISKIRFSDDEKALNRALTELKKSLIKCDVHFKVTKEIISKVELDTKKEGVGKDAFIKAIRGNLSELMSTAKGSNLNLSSPFSTILFMGLQGSGKTTSIVKTANYMKQKGKKVLVVACDVYRFAAVEQLRTLCESVEVDCFYMKDEKNVKKIVNEALSKAKKDMYDIVFIDTAGRLAIDDELMSELKNIKEIAKPSESIYVVDSLTGQDGLRNIESFDSKIGVSGVYLSKFDSDTKGGIAISIAKQTEIPIKFIGTGEKIPDIEQFTVDRIINRIMGMGDMEGLAEKASMAIDHDKAKETVKKIQKGNFTFNDFLAQIEQMKKLGSMKNMLSMIPGMNKKMMDALGNVDLENSDEIRQIKAMVGSMTEKERNNPDIINGSRRERIAKGSGLTVMIVNRNLKQFAQAAKMAKKMSMGKKGPNMASMMSQMQGLGQK